MDVQDAILTRRSIRKYRPDAVPKTVLQNILAAGRQGPSWANTQTPRFVVVSDDGLRQQLAATLSTNNPAGPAMQQAPLVIVGCALRGVAGFKKGEASTDKGDWFMFDTGIAMQNMALSAHAQGMGTVYVGAFDAAAAGKILGVPDDAGVVAMLVLGYPDQEPAERPRHDLSEIVFYERYVQQK